MYETSCQMVVNSVAGKRMRQAGHFREMPGLERLVERSAKMPTNGVGFRVFFHPFVIWRLHSELRVYWCSVLCLGRRLAAFLCLPIRPARLTLVRIYRHFIACSPHPVTDKSIQFKRIASLIRRGRHPSEF